MLTWLIYMLHRSRPSRRILTPTVLLAAAVLLLGCGSSRPASKGVGSSGDGAIGDGAIGDSDTGGLDMPAPVVDAGRLDLPAPPDASGDEQSARDATNDVDAPKADAAAPADTAATDAANGCIYGATTYAPGATFASFDGCNICTCGTNGSVGCTKIACADAGTTPTCTFDSDFRFWTDGGLRAYTDLSRVAVPHSLTVTRDRNANAPPASCAREIPCSSAAEVDVAEIKQALAQADVVAALAMIAKPFYGVDNRPADGTLFMFERTDGRGFSLGSGTTVPAGLRALEELLLQAQSQTVASTACTTLSP